MSRAGSARRARQTTPRPPDRPDPIGELLLKIADGDRAAFDALYARTSAKLFGVTLRILRERAEAEEALQEIYVKVWRQAGRFAPDAGAGMSWLVTVARNQSIDRLRARQTVETTAAADAVESAAVAWGDAPETPEELAIQRSERQRLERLLDQLNPEHAKMVRGAYLEGKSYQQLAEETGTPLNTVKTWLRRSLIKLKQNLDR